METQSVVIRDVPIPALEAFRRGAKVRGLTQAQYLAKLVELHRLLRESGSKVLKQLGLEAVEA